MILLSGQERDRVASNMYPPGTTVCVWARIRRVHYHAARHTSGLGFWQKVANALEQFVGLHQLRFRVILF